MFGLDEPDQDTIATVLEAAHLARVAVLLWGDPGVGKTSVMEAVAKARGARAEVIIGSVREPGDFAGMPMRTPNGMEMMAPRWALDLKPGDLLGLDEITTAPPAVQAALLGVVLHRKVGDRQLPEDLQIVGAANPPSTSGGWPLTAPLANRFLHVVQTLHQETWCQGLLSGFKPPKSRALQGSRDAESEWVGRVASFISAQANLLSVLPKDAASASGPWPSGRTWAMLARVAPHLRPDDNTSLEVVVRGLVGAEAGNAFLEWLNTKDLPDSASVVRNPESLPWDTYREDQVLAILNGVVAWASGKDTKVAWKQAWLPFQCAAKSHAATAAAVVRNLVMIRPVGTDIPASVKEFVSVLTEAQLLGIDS